MSPTMDTPVCLQEEGVDDGVGRVRRSKRLSDNDGGVGRGQGVRDVSEGSETTMEATGDSRRPQVIYDNDRGVK